jgi:hypothetical protein
MHAMCSIVSRRGTGERRERENPSFFFEKKQEAKKNLFGGNHFACLRFVEDIAVKERGNEGTREIHEATPLFLFHEKTKKKPFWRGRLYPHFQIHST